MSTPLAILLVEDRDDDAALIHRTLSRGGLDTMLTRVMCREGFHTQLVARPWDVVLCDFRLPDFDAISALEAYRSSGIDCPFIVVSGVVGEEVAVQVMRSGAHDFVLKDNLSRLVPAVQRELAEAARRRSGRLAEAALDAQERLLASVFDSIHDGICVLDCDLVVVTMNPAMERMLKIGPFDGEGRSCREVIPGCDDGCETCIVGEARRTEKAASAQVRHRDEAGGTVGAYEVSCLPRSGPSGGAGEGFVVVVRDVLEQVQLQERLSRAEKMEALGQFAAGIAHDFNNLIMIILGAVELVRLRVGSTAVASDLDVVTRAGRTAADLVRGLLGFARRSVLNTQVLDLDEVAAETVAMLRRLVPKEIQVHHLPGRVAVTTRADRSRLQQVLLNLCLNARDAIEGAGEIQVETGLVHIDESCVQRRSWASPGDYVLVSVTDNGCGMDEATKARVFDPFFTTKRPDRGTGLGLASVLGIVKQHGGFVEVSSRLGLGTTFRVFLPRVEEAPTTTVVDSPARLRSRSATQVLLVEDSDDLRDVISRFLESLGHSVESARNGVEALEKVRAGLDPEVVITDVSMPRMGGIELYERCRELIPEARFVFCSGYDASGATERGARTMEGDSTWLEKPFDIETIEATIARLARN